MTPSVAMPVLREVVTVATGLGAPPFLMCGTALGFYRDGGFIVGDTDIDLGVLYEHFAPVAGIICGKLIDRGYEVTALVHPFSRCFAVKLKKDEVPVDLVAYIRYRDQVYGDDCRFSPSSYLKFSGVYPTPMLEAYQHVRGFRVPKPIEEYLAFEYGPWWRTPTHEHAYHVAGGRSRVDMFRATRGIGREFLESVEGVEGARCE